MNTKALIIIDIQNDYFEKGAYPLVEPIKASQNAAKILAHFRERRLPIIHIQHINPPSASFMIEGTIGVELHQNVLPIEGENIFEKKFPNSFRDTGLLDFLRERNITELIIVGMMTHMCIDATTRAAFDYGFNCIVIGDACATRDVELDNIVVNSQAVHVAFLSALAFIYAKILHTDQYLNRM